MKDDVSVTMDKSDTDALRYAVQVLERPSLVAHIADVVGTPIELLSQKLPAGASQAVTKATTKSLELALKAALLTIRGGSQESSQILHKALVVASGFTGGAFGILSLPVELPVSTIIIFRSIHGQFYCTLQHEDPRLVDLDALAAQEMQSGRANAA